MAKQRGTLWVASVFASALLASSALSAQPRTPTAAPPTAPTPTGDAALVEARRLYDEGRAHFDGGRFTEALGSFERAYLMRSNPVVLVPIVECQERLGRVVDAIATVERYLRERPNAPDRQAMEQRLQSLRTRPSRVRVMSEPAGVRILVDAQELSFSTPAEVQLAPGRHRIAVMVNGQPTHEREIDALPGGSQEVSLGAATSAPETPPTPAPAPTPVVAAPPPPTPPPALPPAPRRTSPAVWVAASAAGVGVVMGTVFGLMALSDASSFDQTPTQSLYDRGRTNALLSDIGFSVAALSAAVGVIVYFADRDSGRERRPPTAAAPPTRWTVSPGGLVVNF